MKKNITNEMFISVEKSESTKAAQENKMEEFNFFTSLGDKPPLLEHVAADEEPSIPSFSPFFTDTHHS